MKKKAFNNGDLISGLMYVKESDRAGRRRVVVECVCGDEFHVLLESLTKKNPTKSCGCLTSGIIAAQKTKHGKCDSEMYNRWCGMKTRCYDVNDKRYNRYGGRGILICDEWVNDFPAFNLWAISNGGVDGKRLQIDRIDNDKGYHPDNCRFITNAENSRNKGVRKGNKYGISGVGKDKRCNKFYAEITRDGKRKSLGYFFDFFEACCARKSAENRYWND